VTGWAWSGVASPWGLGPTFYNPHFVATPSPVFDYSQPVIVNNVSVTMPEGDTAEPDPAEAEALEWFDEALDAFYRGEFSQALQLSEQALRKLPGDPVLHEFRALALFAIGDFQSAAAVLNSLLATSPGMDWTTMSGLYGDIEAYTNQLRRLETFVRDHPDDAAAPFVLAYHYLVLGETEAAIRSLRAVVQREPRDVTARRLLDALERSKREDDSEVTRAKPAAADSLLPPADAAPTKADAAEDYEWPPEIDLVGRWLARSNEGEFVFTIDEQSHFTWTTEQQGQPVALSGTLLATADTLALESDASGTMVAQVMPISSDKFQFLPAGMTGDEKGLTFERTED
jgi:tetratricopeptide (TPR) repeat protein